MEMMGSAVSEEVNYGLVPLARFAHLADAQEHALVVLAMNLDCLITVDEAGFLIHGEEAFALAINEEFRLYAEEQNLKPELSVVPIFKSGVELALVWIGLLLYCFARQLQDPALVERFLNSADGVMLRGEIYRPFTALFLHGDLEHLLGNAVFGMIFGIFVANSFGPLRGWGLILLSGFLGNLLNVWLHFPEPFRSLGASTAVFGALGLLVGSGLDAAWRARSYRRGLRAFAPLLAGLMIFTMNGIGDPGTDTLAHMTGMLCGVLLGVPAAHFLARRELRGVSPTNP
jgi:rhomboid protease GluP